MVPMPASKPAVPLTVNDFTVLPLRPPPLPSYPQETNHYLYLRANAPKVPTEDTPREVFLVNVPVDTTEVHLRALFAEQLGGVRVESVGFEGTKRVGKGITAPVIAAIKRGRKRKRGVENYEAGAAGQEVGRLPEVWDREVHSSGGTAVVTFVDKASAEMAVKEARRAAKSGRQIVWGAGVEGKLPPLGSARYQAHHALRYPDPATLQQSVDDFMTAFSAREAVRAKELHRVRSVPDADGFVTVTRGARIAPGAREEDAGKKEEEGARKREKRKVGEDFYRFQVREKRKEQQLGLVRGFEEDQRRVEEMRRRRGKMRPE
ncbi:hypothetical protein B0A55_04180 [Friedmanniomyces simplex]|uniref:RRM domain-containing protein n=1 Tax=Friedmanniomyces simplex TaxID=329884 RepID=A0A4U0XKH5_9PEZI|nr:hypothetical protein B0A55_04180 [Friedmanniomyces simplex]